MTLAPDPVVFDPLHPDVPIPRRATADSAGYDLHVYLRGRSVGVRSPDGEGYRIEVLDADGAALVLEPGHTALLPLGFRARLPSGFEAQIRIRSSWAFKYGLHLPNAPGTIDADYPDEWLVMMRNGGSRAVTVRHGDRVAQAVLARFAAPEWIPGAVGVSSDRVGGLGSTG